MIKCSSCSKEFPNESESCPSCGVALEDAVLPTRLFTDNSPPRQAAGGVAAQKLSLAHAHSSGASRSIDDARFIPGTVLVARRTAYLSQRVGGRLVPRLADSESKIDATQ
jgi:hypothetical protein